VKPESDQQVDGGRDNRPVARFGKGTAKCCGSKVHRPVWRDDDGQLREANDYFGRLMVSGRREVIALNTCDRPEAAKRASQLCTGVRTVGWDTPLGEYDPERHTPKSDTEIADANASLAPTDINHRTRENYINALRWFAAPRLDYTATKKTFGPEDSAAYRQRVEAMKLSALKHDAVPAIINRHIQRAGSQINVERSARISAASLLRTAKADLKRAVAEQLNLGELKPFAVINKPEGATTPAYTSTFDAGEATRKDGKGQRTAPSTYSALLLDVSAGSRRREIHNLLWRRVDTQGERVPVLADGSWAPKTGGSERPVQLSARLIADLERFRVKAGDHMTNPASLDRAVALPRTKGVDSPMSLHTLQEEFGNLINDAADLFTAASHCGTTASR